MLQIIDISNEILFHRANGEKKLLSLINATVSHEMRNPLNAISSQNVNQTDILKRFQEVIDMDLYQLSTKNLRRKLQSIKDEQVQSLMIQDSSQKLLSFIVNDMLDFA
jgi:signal transduction histidine kinase